MEPLKTYVDGGRVHRLVRVAKAKQLTGIKITRVIHREWILECDQVPRLSLGYGIKEAEARIDKIKL